MFILVVDDSPTQRALWIFALSATGARIVSQDDAEAAHGESGDVVVCIARDGKQALRILRTRSVDLLVTDVDMPGLDGWQLTREAQRIFPELPTIIISSKVTTGQELPLDLAGSHTSIVSKQDRNCAVDEVCRFVTSGLSL